MLTVILRKGLLLMDNYYTNSCTKLVSYDQIYTSELRPKLMALDLFLKENNAPFHVYEVANILEIEPKEIICFMSECQIKELDATSLFSFMIQSSSEIGGYILRQWKYHHISHYTAETIAEIYKLNLHKVQTAFDDLNVTLVTDDELIEVFKRIHMTRF